MKKLNGMLTQHRVNKMVGFLNFACYVMVALCIGAIVLSILGRQTFTLHDSTGMHELAMLADTEYGARDKRGINITTDPVGTLHVYANDEIDTAARIGISALVIVSVLPMFFAFWHLTKVLSNIKRGAIFIEENARRILYFGLLQLFSAVGVPILQVLICAVSTAISANELYVSTGQNMIAGIFTSMAFLVAAYIIRYGVHLQDEADHTL